MMKISLGTIKMTEGKLGRNMLRYAIPVVLSGLLQMSFNLADTAVVSNFASDVAFAAVGSTTVLISLITTLFMGLSIGCSSIAAKCFGAGDIPSLKALVGTSAMLAVSCGVVLAAVGQFVAEPLLPLLNCPQEVIPAASAYMRLVFLSMPAMLIYNFGSGIIQAGGDTRRPLIYITIGGVVNVVLNLVFVIGLTMEAEGVAIATVISQYLSAAFIVRHFIVSKEEWHILIKDLKFTGPTLMQILRIGVPSGISNFLMTISVVIIQAAINNFGKTAINGNTAASSIEGLLAIVISGFSQASSAFVGQNYGAGNFSRVKKTALIGIVGGLSVGEILGFLLFAIAPEVLGFFNTDSSIISIGVIRMKYMCCFFGFCAAMNIASGCQHGLGSSTPSMLISFIGSCVFRIGWILTIAKKVGSLESIYVSYPICWIITASFEILAFAIILKVRQRQSTKNLRLECDV